MSDSPICDRASRCEIPTQPADVRHGFVMSNIRQTALMTVLKGSDLLHASQLSLEFLDGREDLSALVSAGFGLSV